jgi:hypothetical protein
LGPTVINGLPAHVLLVHVVVVLVPLTALVLVAGAVRPAWIRRLGVALPLLALATLASVPLTTHAGEWLERHTASTPLLRRHTELGDGLLPWALGLFVLATALWWWVRRTAATASGDSAQAASGTVAVSLPLRIAAIGVCAAVAAGAIVQVYRIGDSGAKAAWQGNPSSQQVDGQGR